MIELYVFDRQLNLIGEISEYINLEIDRKVESYSQLILNIQANEETLAILNKGNIITTQTSPQYGYVIQHFAYSQESDKTLEIVALSLNFYLTYRTIYPQQVFNGTHSNAIRHFVNINAINTATNRRIPNLVLGANNTFGYSTTFTKTGGDLLELSLGIASEFGAMVEILIDQSTKQLVLEVVRGVNRSASQSVNNRVMFSDDFDNVLNQNYYDSDIEYRNASIVAGEGDGAERIIVDRSTLSGLDRREVFIDARDLQSEYQDENGVEQTLTQIEYTNALFNRGNEKLSETRNVETFEAQIDNSQFVYGVDYFLGDIVSVKNLTLNIVVDVMISQVKIVSNSSGVVIVPSLGTPLPDLYRKGGQ